MYRVILVGIFLMSLVAQASAQTSSGTYYVFGGNTATDPLYSCTTPIASGFTYIGSSSTPTTFSQDYPYYIVTNYDARTYTPTNDPNMKQAYFDAIEWSDGTYLSGSWGSTNTPNYANLIGAPDKQFMTMGSATAGGCFQAPKPSGATSIKVISADVNDVVITSVNIHDIGKNGFKVDKPEAINGAKFYLTVATDSAFASPIAGFDNLDITEMSTVAVTGLAQGQYYIKAVAKNSDESLSNTSVTKINLANEGTYYVYGVTIVSGSSPTYTLLGQSAKTQTFSGNYPYYIVSSGESPYLDCNNTPSMVFIDAVRWEDGSYLSSTLSGGRIRDVDNLLGAPDKKYAAMGMYENASSGTYSCGGAYFANPSSSNSLTVIPMSNQSDLPVSSIMLLIN